MDTTEQRANVRVKDRLHITYRLIETTDTGTGKGADQYFPFIWTKYPNSIIAEDAEEANYKILSHIIDLNRKIDVLAELLIQENKLPAEVTKSRDVCISASGIKINISEPSNHGQKIALCIVLPFTPPAKLFVMGEITRSAISEPVSDEDDIKYETAVRFLDLKEEDYEKIIKYIFKRQRDMLKDKKRLTDEEPCNYNEST